ncbi:MAG TPA: RHS repeat domain-containing protein, partial [Pirellulales bacterium]|nr:RHS repeat domain-containing protein [Pirellulales bacterium]
MASQSVPPLKPPTCCKCCDCGCGCDDSTGVCPACGAASTDAASLSLLPGSSDASYSSGISSCDMSMTPLAGDNGMNWIKDPYVGKCTTGGQTLTVVVFSPCRMFQFTGSGPSFTATGGANSPPVSLKFDYSQCAYIFDDCNGDEYTFDCNGNFQKLMKADGTDVQMGNPDMHTSVTDPVTGNVTTTSVLYAMVPSGPNAGRIAGVTLRRQVNGGPWTEISRVLNTYYNPGDPSGNEGDLQTVTSQVLLGSAWVTTKTSYYRYYTSASAPGFVHGLKYVLGGEAYRRLQADPQVCDPLLAPDSLVAQYADKYYEYDSLHRATKAVTNGGLYTYLYSYASSSFTPSDYNTWVQKTTVTRPDGNLEIFYANSINQIMLHVLQDGSGNKWIEYHKFDSNAHEILMAEPSAVTSYNEGVANLGVTLNTTGLIHATTYYSGSSVGAGYKQYEQVQQGGSGTPINVRQYTYTSHTAGAGGPTIILVASVTDYQSDSGGGSNPTTTSYSYSSFYSGTNQPTFKTTTLPVIATGQNGDGNTYVINEMFDTFGNRIAMQDQRGFITTYQFDVALGVITRMVQDDAPPSGSGWTANPGTRLKLTTDVEYDDQGRVTQTLSPAFNSNGQSVRTASWTVYRDDLEETWTAQGYATGTGDGPQYDYTLVNPVVISRMDDDGRTIDSIQAVRLPSQPAGVNEAAVCGDTSLSNPASPAPSPFVESPGRLSAADSFPQSTWVRWSSSQYSNQSQLVSTRMYFCVPPCGLGCLGTNYNETAYGYDSMNRQNRLVAPGGTITRSVFDLRGLLLSSWVGTDDACATDNDPTGGGAMGNNMVIVTGNVYDNGNPGGDGNLTQQTDYVDATGSNDHITTFVYDFRDRLTQTTQVLVSTGTVVSVITVNTYDNLDRVTLVQQYNTSIATANLIRQSGTAYDNLGRVYQTARTSVTVPGGAIGNNLTDNTWYDPAGNIAKSLSAGASQTYTKTQYDSVGRQSGSFTGYSPGSNDSPWTVGANDKIFGQSVPTYDAASHVLLMAAFQRNQGDSTTTGALVNANARMSYAASWYDGIGRQIASADYGTNGDGSTPILPTSPPASGSSVLVSLTQYNERGEAYLATDPAGKATRTDADDAGRVIRTTENYVPLPPCQTCGSTSPCDCGPSPADSCPQAGNDQNVIVEMTYNADNLVLTITARNPVTGDQKTCYQYGTTLPTSSIARNDLRTVEIYPDATDSTDHVSYTYNRQGQPITKTDQSGTVHAYSYDRFGRITSDAVTQFGTGVDNLVSRIATAYEIRGMMSQVTSYSGASIFNQVTLTYNGFEQLLTDQQDQSGSGGPNLTVDYGYADGTNNTIRRMSITYPYSTGARSVIFTYASGDDDKLSRVSSLMFNATTVAAYTYFGLGSVAGTSYSAGTFGSTLASSTNYPGFDQFGRVINLPWTKTTTGDLAQIGYGYDLASNRTYRQDIKAESLTKSFDEIYGYDGMQRLVTASRGQLNTGNTRLQSSTFGQTWGLDATGNWSQFTQFDAQSSTFAALDQQRTSNKANEITAVGATVGPVWQTPAYDRNGNMTTVPEPTDMTLVASATWDAWNRLVKYQDASSNYHNSFYDGLNRRVLYVEADTPRAYVYSDQWQVLEERVIPYSTPDRQYVWGLRYVDDLVLRDRSTSGTLNERLYALQDGNWNVIAIADSTA